MALTINNNSMAANASKNVNNNYNGLEKSSKRLSSGLRINSAKDDPAGMAILELMLAEGAALRQGSRNAQDGISLVQTADSALQGTNKLLTRMKELATQAATGTYNDAQRGAINSEYQAMAAEVTRISKSTEFNGISLLDGSASGTHDGSDTTSTGDIRIHFGSGNDASQDYTDISIDDTSAESLGVGDVGTLPDSAGSNISTQSAAQEALAAVNAAIAAVSQTSASLGATQNSLESAIDSTNVQALNLTAAASRISDADIAKESKELVREQMLTKSSLSMLLEANTSPNMMLQLISKKV